MFFTGHSSVSRESPHYHVRISGQLRMPCLAKEWMTEEHRHPCHQHEKLSCNLPESFFASSSSSAKFMEMEGASEGVLVRGFM